LNSAVLKLQPFKKGKPHYKSAATVRLLQIPFCNLFRFFIPDSLRSNSRCEGFNIHAT